MNVNCPLRQAALTKWVELIQSLSPGPLSLFARRERLILVIRGGFGGCPPRFCLPSLLGCHGVVQLLVGKEVVSG